MEHQNLVLIKFDLSHAETQDVEQDLAADMARAANKLHADGIFEEFLFIFGLNGINHVIARSSSWSTMRRSQRAITQKFWPTVRENLRITPKAGSRGNQLHQFVPRLEQLRGISAACFCASEELSPALMEIITLSHQPDLPSQLQTEEASDYVYFKCWRFSNYKSIKLPSKKFDYLLWKIPEDSCKHCTWKSEHAHVLLEGSCTNLHPRDMIVKEDGEKRTNANTFYSRVVEYPSNKFSGWEKAWRKEIGIAEFAKDSASFISGGGKYEKKVARLLSALHGEAIKGKGKDMKTLHSDEDEEEVSYYNDEEDESDEAEDEESEEDEEDEAEMTRIKAILKREREEWEEEEEGKRKKRKDAEDRLDELEKQTSHLNPLFNTPYQAFGYFDRDVERWRVHWRELARRHIESILVEREGIIFRIALQEYNHEKLIWALQAFKYNALEMRDNESDDGSMDNLSVNDLLSPEGQILHLGKMLEVDDMSAKPRF